MKIKLSFARFSTITGLILAPHIHGADTLNENHDLTSHSAQEQNHPALKKMEESWKSFIDRISSKYRDHKPCTLEHKTEVLSYLHHVDTTLDLAQGRLIENIGTYLKEFQEKLLSIRQKRDEERVRISQTKKFLDSLQNLCSKLPHENSLGAWFEKAKKLTSERFKEDDKEYRKIVNDQIVRRYQKIYDICRPEISDKPIQFEEQQQKFRSLESNINRAFYEPVQDPLIQVLELYLSHDIDKLLDSFGKTRSMLSEKTGSKIEANAEGESVEKQILKYLRSESHNPTTDNPLKEEFEVLFMARQKEFDTLNRKLNYSSKDRVSSTESPSALIDEEESIAISGRASLRQPPIKKTSINKKTRCEESIPSESEILDEPDSDSVADAASTIEPQKPKHHPHDKFVKRTLQVIPIAIDLFQHVLSPQDLEYIDLSTLKLMDTTFVDDDMEKRIANTAFTVKLKSEKNEEKYLYLLVKHLSSPDESLLDKLHGYQGQVLKHRNNLDKKEKEKYLIRVLTVVLYTGKCKLPPSSDIRLRDSFRPGGYDSSIYLLDLRGETEATLKDKFNAFRPAALALKMVRNNLLPHEIPKESLQDLQQYTEYINMITTYILCAEPSDERDEYEEVLREMLENEEVNPDEDDSLKNCSQNTLINERKRIVIRMRDWGQTPEQIAEVIDISLEDVIRYLNPDSFKRKKRHRVENDNGVQLASNLDSPHEDNDIIDSSELVRTPKDTYEDIDKNTQQELRQQPLPFTDPSSISSIIKDFVDSCEAGTLGQQKRLEDKIKQIEDAWIKRNKTCLENQYIFPVRPSGTDGYSSRPRIVQQGVGKSAHELEALFYQILNQSLVLDLLTNGAWGTNNCMFEAMANHPEVIPETADFFGSQLSARDKEETNQVRTDNSYTEGGKILRRIVCQWILDNMNKVLFEEISADERETGGAPQITVRDIVRSIDDRQDPADYIIKLRDSTQFIDEEISVIISVMINRPIIVLTEAEPSMLTSRLLDSFLSRRQWEKTRIYLHNDSQARGGGTSSGTHYSGIRPVHYEEKQQ